MLTHSTPFCFNELSDDVSVVSAMLEGLSAKPIAGCSSNPDGDIQYKQRSLAAKDLEKLLALLQRSINKLFLPFWHQKVV